MLLNLLNYTFLGVGVLVSREEWNAFDPKMAPTPMENPVPYVVIHHSYKPAACYNRIRCIAAMKSMQNFHQIDKSWNDIGYNFAVGGNGEVYEGRGWSAVGAHAIGFNNRSIGICLIGDWSTKMPPKIQLNAVRLFIKYGVKNGKIQKNYSLIGHKEASNTECPGNRLFGHITRWKHFTNNTQRAK